MTQNYTYIFTDALTGTLLNAIPVGSAQFGSQLNQPKSMSGNINPVDPNIAGLNVWSSTKPARTCVFIDYNGSIVWGGFTGTPRTFQLSQQSQFNLQANELWAYWTQRYLATDYSAPPYSGITGQYATMPIWDAASTGSPANAWDPVLIAGQVIYDASNFCAVPNGGSSIVYGTLLGGMPVLYNGYSTPAAYLASPNATLPANYINITAPWTSLQSVDSFVTQLAQLGLGVGFDFAIDAAYSGNQSVPISAAINLSAPTRGRPYTSTNLVVDTGNCYDYTVTESGDQTAWQIYERGGSGAINVNININAQEAGYPLLESVQDRSYIVSGTIQNILAEIGTSDIYVYSFPPVSFQVVLDPSDPACPLGSFQTGDHVWLSVQPDARFPGGYEGEWRIVQWDMNVPDAGAPKMTLTLNPPVAPVAYGPAV